MDSAKYATPAQTKGESKNGQGNFPGEYDSTSSGGYGSGSNVWSQRFQRGFDNTAPPTNSTTSDTGISKSNQNTEIKKGGRQGADKNKKGLIDQSVSGGNLGEEIQDARQGGEDSWPNDSLIL